MHVAALEQSAPPSALVDDGNNILHLSPTAGRFILHTGGPVSNVLPVVVRPELRLDLKFALTRAMDQNLSTLTHPVEVVFDGERRRVALHVVPVQKDERTGRNALVFFLDSGVVDEREPLSAQTEAQPDEVRRLHAELRAAQKALVASRHSNEASIQDLRAANEELQSMNEEYRSTAEELETSKEELQSINEELHTVNAEMKGKLESISAAHSDLQNLTAATEVGTLFLDGQLRIRMFTPPVSGIFNIAGMDIGRLITDFTHQLDYDAIERDVRQLLAELVPIEREVMTRDGRWYAMRLRPYRTIEDRIDGTVVTFVDITGRRAIEQALSQSEQQLRALVRASSQVLYRMSPDWSEMRELSGGGVLFNTERPTGNWFETYIPAEERTRVRAAIRNAVETRGLFDLEHQVYRTDGSVGWVHSRAVGSFDESGSVTEWFGSANDVTARLEAQAALRESEERFAQFADSSSDALWIRDAATLQMEYVSPAMEDIYGVPLNVVLDGPEGWTALIEPDDRSTALAHLDQAKAGDAVVHEFRIRRPSDGVMRWISDTSFPLRDAQGRVQRIGGIAQDVTEAKLATERQEVLVAELQHRTRNLIAVVKGVANDTMRQTGPSEAFRPAFADRLSALSRVQGLLSRAEVEPISIDALVRLELDALGAGAAGGQITIVGPEVFLRPSSVQTLALALHELATNARKYGALSHEHGRLEVSWQQRSEAGERRLTIEWLETGLEQAPERTASAKVDGGYGRELIEHALPHTLGAQTSYALSDSGVRCTIDLAVRLTKDNP